MKRTYPLFALGSVLSGVEASRRSNNKRDVDWRPAQVTVAVDQLLHGTSPKPTNAPRAPDPAPERSLDKRANYDNTCAYVSGIKASSLYCNPDNACVYNSIFSVVGCCPDASLSALASQGGTGTSVFCPVWTTCYDSTDSASYTTDNGYTVYCGESSYPTCIQHIYQDPVYSGYTLWGCALSERTDYVYDTVTQLSATSTTTPASSTTTTTPPTTPPTNPASTTTPITSPIQTTPIPAPSTKATPAGAIAGGVVGGVVGLALIGLALFFLLRRNKKSGPAAPAAAATGPTSPSQGPPTPGSPGGGGYYDPNQPQMAQQQGQYGYGAAGFGPVDPRASIAKPPYVVQQAEYNYQQPNQFSSPPGSPPPGSPAPAYNGVPGSTSPPAGAYGQQPYPPAQYNQGYQQAQPYGQQPGGQPTHHAVELDTQRGDGEMRELAG